MYEVTAFEITQRSLIFDPSFDTKRISDPKRIFDPKWISLIQNGFLLNLVFDMRHFY